MILFILQNDCLQRYEDNVLFQRNNPYISYNSTNNELCLSVKLFAKVLHTHEVILKSQLPQGQSGCRIRELKREQVISI